MSSTKPNSNEETQTVIQEAPLPRFNQIVEMPRIDTVHDLPDVAYPYFIATKDGLYQHWRNALGRGIFPTKDLPKTLRSIGNRGGYFFWEAPIIPATICAQAVDFFRRIYEKYKTEAEIILTMHRETKEWRIFVPNQKTSSGHVKYEFNPQHIHDDYLIVGTMHSHPSFNAFHSGTDTDDAKKMDGVHFTIGHVNSEKPDVVGMVSLQGMLVDYDDISELADFSDLDAAKAPEWWDRFVEIPNSSSWSSKSTTTKPSGYSYPTSRYAPSVVSRDYQRNSNAFWAESFTDEFLDALYESGLLTYNDTSKAAKEPEKAKNESYWRDLFLEKMTKCEKILGMLGREVTHTIKIKKVTKEDLEHPVKVDTPALVSVAGKPLSTETAVVVYNVEDLPPLKEPEPLTDEEIREWLLPNESYSELSKEDQAELADLIRSVNDEVDSTDMSLEDVVAFRSVVEAADKAVLEN